MTEERITETRTPSGDTHTTHTVVTDGESRRSGGSGWVIALIVLVLAVGAIFIFSPMSGAEVAKDNAVAEAATEVGEAAGQVGDAAQNAGEAVQDAVEN
ncbi:MAG: hypothetical protein JKY36_07270 [Erythrobacter sp.]|nr:hypothetical protein [Erythrobacter sp.]